MLTGTLTGDNELTQDLLDRSLCMSMHIQGNRCMSDHLFATLLCTHTYLLDSINILIYVQKPCPSRPLYRTYRQSGKWEERGEMDLSTSIKRLKTQRKITVILPLSDGVHALATCKGSHQIWKVNLETGDIKVYCGQGDAGKDDGQPHKATFNAPRGLAMKANGSVIVADLGNNLIREISPCGK